MSFADIGLDDGTKIAYVPEADYQSDMQQVEEALCPLRREAELAIHGGTLHTEYYLRENARASLVLLHGYTESAEKFREMVWYFWQAGFQVFSYDHRGHGRSLRQVQPGYVTHVDHFSDYVEDLEIFLKEIVLPNSAGSQPMLFGHSMGGAVAAQFLLKHPDVFSRALLSSPMIAPSTAPFPRWLGHMLAAAGCLVGSGRKMAFVGKPFDAAAETLETSCSTSKARFSYYTDKRIRCSWLQNNAPTYCWVRESIGQTQGLLHGEAAARVRIPVLLCQAGLDDVVCLPEQQQFIDRLPYGKLVTFPEAKHEIFNSTDDTMQPYVKTVLNFFMAK